MKALLTAKKHGFFTQLDSWGGMGQLGFDFDYRPVSTTGGLCAAPASPTAPTPCVMRLLFRAFEDGFRGTIEVDSTGGATCPATPPKWVPWIIKGVQAWEPVFRAAGFSNSSRAPV